MQVNVLIPVHNRIDSSMECLACLDKQTYPDIRIVIVDDGSTDGTYEKIKERYPEVDILKGDGSLWWTGAMYIGVEHIMKYAEVEDFILSLNNDTVFDPDFVELLVKKSLEFGRAITGSMEVEYHKPDKILSSGVWFDSEKYYFGDKKTLPENKNETVNEHVNVLPGRGTLIPIEVFKKIGNYNKELFPHYIADYDFTFRAFNTGIKLILPYDVIIYTRSDLTGVSIKESRPLTLREAYTHFFSIKSDNNIIDHINFIRVHGSKKHRKKLVLMSIMGAVLRLRFIQVIAKPAIIIRQWLFIPDRKYICTKKEEEFR